MSPVYTWKDADGNVYSTMTISEDSDDQQLMGDGMGEDTELSAAYRDGLLSGWRVASMLHNEVITSLCKVLRAYAPQTGSERVKIDELIAHAQRVADAAKNMASIDPPVTWGDK